MTVHNRFERPRARRLGQGLGRRTTLVGLVALLLGLTLTGQIPAATSQPATPSIIKPGASPRPITATDRAGILDLISTYSQTYDAKDAKAWADTFTRDGLIVFRWGPEHEVFADAIPTMRNRAERLKFARARFSAFTAEGRQTYHHQNNTLLRRGADGRLRGRTMLLLVSKLQGQPAQIALTGYYEDLFVKVGGEWRFQKRVAKVDQLPGSN